MGNHERYDIPNADVLFTDVWAEDEPDAPVCRACDHRLASTDRRCPECNEIVPICVGACAACISPVCIGDPLDRHAR